MAKKRVGARLLLENKSPEVGNLPSGINVSGKSLITFPISFTISAAQI
jgi:hypothetical protein